MRASKGVSEPRAASVASAPVTSARAKQHLGLEQRGQRMAVENCVPLSSASPSFGPSTIGASPACSSACSAGRRSPCTNASPTPIIAAVMCASGARSPDAPTDPCAGTTGTTSRASIACEQLQGLRPDARGALRQAGQLERHHQPGDRPRHRLADAGGMGQHDVALQGCRSLRVDAHAGELAEAGVDAVHGRAPGNDAGHRIGAGAHARPAARIEPRRARHDRWRTSRRAACRRAAG